MLTKEDVEMIRKTRREVYANRTESVTLVYVGEPTVDDITGNESYADPILFESQAVVTAISSVANPDRFLAAGIEVEKDDKLFHIDYPELPLDNKAAPGALVYADDTYEILIGDAKGIGSPSRLECYGRKRR